MKQLVVTLVALAALGLQGCQKEGCLGLEPNCRVPPPCPKVAFTCEPALASQLRVERISSVTQRPGGLNGLGTVGDVKLSNGFVDVVIANVGTQNFLDPNGGSILDLTPHAKNKDTVNDVFQAVGLLPRDAAFYTQLELIEEPGRVAVQVKGTLDGIPSVPIITRYELTPCDRGVRVRTEILNGSTDTKTWSMVDGFYWSGREALPFVPITGEGFVHASFGLTTINAAYRLFPYFAASSHSSDETISAIALASCTESALEGFHSDQISAAGLKRQIVPPRGSLIYERYLAVADSKGVAGAVDLALEIRKQVLDEKFITLTGKVERLGGASLDSERQASVLIAQGTLTTPLDARIPWTQLVPNADGTFSARVPAGKTYVVEAHAFGRKQVEREYGSLNADTELGSFVLPGTGTLDFRVEESPGRRLIDAELFLVPVDETQAQNVVGTLHGRFATCAPWLGSPAGASPACNRVLVHDGLATADVPMGRFDIYAFHGPYWSLAKQTIEVTGGPQQVTFNLRELPLKPANTLSADLHVHGAASFDSSIPDRDRVLSFAASDLDVVIGTDHDVVMDYARIVRDLGLEDRLATVVGLESTGHIPFLSVPGYGFPLVIGHYNFWPLKFDPSLPRNGGPYDERVEPGQLFERTKGLFTAEPFIELNHPWADPEFGRDLGFPRAILMDLNQNLPAGDDGTRQAFFTRTPSGSTFANNAHHAQEVMNGTDNGLFLQYRAFWHYTLSQGVLKTGTANSDSHSLTDNTVGMPHNLVTSRSEGGTNFDVVAFNRALKEGRSQGTNGPVIRATIEDTANVERSYSLLPFAPRAGASVKVTISSAPWVPVQEVRFIVNGEVKKVIGNLPIPADPFAQAGSLVRFEGEVPLSELTAGITQDAWLVIEAGRPLMLAGDLGGGLEGAKDGMPDTTDNDGDGVVDAADVKAGAKIGPLADPPKPKRGETGYDFGAITNGYPLAFTNPFILDLNGDGAFTAPGVKGARQ